MTSKSTFLVLGATGGTGKHFVAQALKDGHTVRALVRTPSKLAEPDRVEITQGSITDPNVDLDSLVKGVDYVLAMLGDREAQMHAKINTEFVGRLVPAMRRHGVRKFLYLAGGFSKPYGESLGPILWILRKTLARAYEGQHQDNDAVMEYLATQAMDIDWMVHRAGIGGDGPSKGVLERSHGSNPSIGTHIDCADFNYRTIMNDKEAIHKAFFSTYTKA